MINAALFGWPVVTTLMALRAHWPVVVIVSIFGGYLLLPQGSGINLPLLPSFTKHTIPCLTLLVLALILRPGQPQGPVPQAMPEHMVRPGWLPGTKIGAFLVMLFPVGAILTTLANGDRLVYGPTVINGLSLYDGFAVIVAGTAQFVPLLLGRKYFSHTEMHRLLLAGFAIAAFLYSFPTLYEVRMSPQLNRIVYGFFPNDWHQHVRGDGFRPIVFLGHGLRLSLFMAMGVLCALGLYRISSGPVRFWALVCAVWLFATLVLSKSLGALIITVLLAPVVLFLSMRLQLLVAMVLAGAVLSYPALRNIDVIPTERLVAIAADIDSNRAQSLAYRFRHEDNLLAKASERPLLGWGGWGRSRVYNEETGADMSVTDGSWVIAFGTGGWAEYLSKFGLLTLPIMLLAVHRRKLEVSGATAALGMVLVANCIDLIPNSGQTPVTWLIAGALLGRLELAREAAPEQAAADVARPERPVRPTRSAQAGGLVYTRQTTLHDRHARMRRI